MMTLRTMTLAQIFGVAQHGSDENTMFLIMVIPTIFSSPAACSLKSRLVLIKYP